MDFPVPKVMFQIVPVVLQHVIVLVFYLPPRTSAVSKVFHVLRPYLRRFRFGGTTRYNRSLHASSRVWSSSYTRSISNGTVRSSGPTVSSNSHPAHASETFPADRLHPPPLGPPLPAHGASCSSLRRSSLSPASPLRVRVYLDRR